MARMKEQAPTAGASPAEIDEIEHRRAQEALHESEERYRALVENSPDLIVRFDRDLRMTFMNPAVLRRTAASADALLGRTAQEYGAAPPAASPWEQAARRALETGLPQRFDHTSIWQGQARSYDAVAVPERGPDGAVVSVMAVARDITERKQTEEALELALRASNAGTWVWDITTGHLEWSPELFALFGFDPERGASFEAWESALHPEDREYARARIERSLRDKRQLDSEYRIVMPDGQVAWINALGVGQYDDQGRPIRMAGICLDITGRKLAERETEAQRRLLDMVVKQLPIGVNLVRGSDLTFQVVNEVYQAIAPGRAMLGRSISDVWPELHPWLSDVFRRVIDTGEPHRRVDELIPLVPSTGGPSEPRYFSWELYRVRLPGDEGWGVLNTVWETTERKRIELALEEANQRLREEDRRKNEFLAVLSHELRNPLSAIRNSLSVLDRAAPKGEQARLAKAIVDRQVDQLVRLVDDLLDVTRITRGKIHLQRRQFELADLLRRTVEDHRSTFATAGVELEVCLTNRPLLVDADAARVAQVVGNLLQNAAKFTGRGGHVMLALDEDVARRMAVIRVRDSGIGISPDVLPRLFEPFMQAESTLDRSRGGLGLGLALVKGMVELHGGTVEALSAGVNRGSEFVVRLPAIVEEKVDSRPDGETRGGAAGSRKTRRVLVVDDNVDATTCCAMLLRLEGHDVRTANDGRSAIEIASEFRPEIILLDIGMPSMDGYEVARRLRAEPSGASCVLVAVTGYGHEEDRRRSSEAGFDHHLVKPVTFEALEQILGSSPNR